MLGFVSRESVWENTITTKLVVLNTRAQPISRDIKGAPFLIGDHVVIVKIVDNTADETLLGRRGLVAFFEYSCGCGQTYPEDPMIGVGIDGVVHEFWKEELALTSEVP